MIQELRKAFNENKLPFIVLPSFIFIMAVVFFVINWRHNKAYEEISFKYPPVTSEFNFRGIITRIDHPGGTKRNNPFSVFIIIDDSVQVHLMTGFELNKHLILEEVLKVGDLIIKVPDSYSIEIHKIAETDTIIYKFELADDLGYPQKESYKN